MRKQTQSMNTFKINPRHLFSIHLLFATFITAIFINITLAVTPSTGEPFPNFEVTSLKGKTYTAASLKGKILILHFMATWCSACKKELPILNEFYEKQNPSQFEILGLSIDRTQDKDLLLKLQEGVKFPLALLKEAKSYSFALPSLLPLTYLIDQKGIIKKVFTPNETSTLTPETLTQEVKPLQQP